MLYVPLRGPVSFGDDCIAEEEWPGAGWHAWFDARGRLCKLALAQPRTLWLELTPGAATHAPAITRLIELQGGDPAQYSDAALDDSPLRPRPRGRPPDIIMFEAGGKLHTWPILARALSVYFEVNRLIDRKATCPHKQVARNRDLSQARISQLYRLGRSSIGG